MGYSTCPESEPTISMCVCKNGFYLLDGECVSGAKCEVGTGSFSKWTEWTDCSVTCGEGTRSKSRICLGPGSCKPDQDTVKETTCDAGICGLISDFFYFLKLNRDASCSSVEFQFGRLMKITGQNLYRFGVVLKLR